MTATGSPTGVRAEPGRTYYWRARAVGGGGGVSAWTAASSFTVAGSPGGTDSTVTPAPVAGSGTTPPSGGTAPARQDALARPAVIAGIGRAQPQGGASRMTLTVSVMVKTR